MGDFISSGGCGLCKARAAQTIPAGPTNPLLVRVLGHSTSCAPKKRRRSSLGCFSRTQRVRPVWQPSTRKSHPIRCPKISGQAFSPPPPLFLNQETDQRQNHPDVNLPKSASPQVFPVFGSDGRCFRALAKTARLNPST